MPSGVPAEASVELFNKLLDLPFDDTAAIGQIEFRLRQLRKKNPLDVRVAVALLEALTKSGKAQEAIQLADWIWDVRSWLEHDTTEAFFIQLAQIGMFQRSNELIAYLNDSPETHNPERYNPWIWCISVGLGDTNLIGKFLESLENNAFRNDTSKFLSELRDTGIIKHFSSHQGIINEIAFGLQCGYNAELIWTGEEPELTVSIFVNKPRSERRELEDHIDNRLAEFYQGLDLPDTIYVPLITTSIFDITACPVPRLS